MNRGTAVAAGFGGAIVGAIAGIPYLSRFGDCSDLGPEAFQCMMGRTLGPYLSAIAIGIVAALIIGNAVAAVTRRSLAPGRHSHSSGSREVRRRSRDAVDLDDPASQIAAWGMPPGASQRTVSLSEPIAYRSRQARSVTAPHSPRGGAGYGAARAARASMLAAGRNPR